MNQPQRRPERRRHAGKVDKHITGHQQRNRELRGSDPDQLRAHGRQQRDDQCRYQQREIIKIRPAMRTADYHVVAAEEAKNQRVDNPCE